MLRALAVLWGKGGDMGCLEPHRASAEFEGKGRILVASELRDSGCSLHVRSSDPSSWVLQVCRTHGD